MGVVDPLGYKPQVICGLLDIGDQTLRYWRSSIIPNGHRAFFSGRDVFALKIVSVLINDMGFDVTDLEEFKLKELFSFCRKTPFSELKGCILLLDRKKHSLRVTTDERDIESRNRYIARDLSPELVPFPG